MTESESESLLWWLLGSGSVFRNMSRCGLLTQQRHVVGIEWTWKLLDRCVWLFWYSGGFCGGLRSVR